MTKQERQWKEIYGDVSDPHSISGAFDNFWCPNSKIFCVPCPTHQLKNMIAALYSSAKILQQRNFIAELSEYARSVPRPGDNKNILKTIQFLEACENIFEQGILSHAHVNSMDHAVVKNIRSGMKFFSNWANSLTAEGKNIHDLHQVEFLSWQTWDLLRLMVTGFLSFLADFFQKFPGYYIIPVRLNGSAIETLFSQTKQVKGDCGTLSARYCDVIVTCYCDTLLRHVIVHIQKVLR
eukprot:Pompholyxophrys_punicea_v1_NODE_795_length_1280_cov_4.899756.p1 type:complete len:237 gc:universal NODE_795_length_1280_cov_4.899756:399-1109(+)